MTVTTLRSGLLGLAAAVLTLTFLVGALVGAAAPADAADLAAKRGSSPARNHTEIAPSSSVHTIRTADRSGAQGLVAGGALVLIGAGIGAGVVRARRHPELVASGH
jgi:hypothetical protein